MNNLLETLRLRHEELKQNLAASAMALSEIQSEHQQIQKEMDMVEGLLAIHDENQNTKPPIQKPTESNHAKQIFNGSAPHSLTSFEGSISEILNRSGVPMHIGLIENELRRQKIPIPGRGNTANIITRMRRANGSFVRVGSGIYALAKWDIAPSIPPRRRRSKSRRRTRKSNG